MLQQNKRYLSHTFLLSDSPGLHRTDSHELSPSEARSLVVQENNKTSERRTAPKSGAPGRTSDKGGFYRNQQKPEAVDPDPLMEERHENSTQIVVGFIVQIEQNNLTRNNEYILCVYLLYLADETSPIVYVKKKV